MRYFSSLLGGSRATESRYEKRLKCDTIEVQAPSFMFGSHFYRARHHLRTIFAYPDATGE